MDGTRKTFLTVAAGAFALLAAGGVAQEAKAPKAAKAPPSAAAGDIAGFFGAMGDQIYKEDCIFDLSDEQIEVQEALVEAYIKRGAAGPAARKLAVKQIQVPALSDKCKKLKGPAKVPAPVAALPPAKTKPSQDWTPSVKDGAKKAAPIPLPKDAPRDMGAAAPAVLASKKVLPQWDCAPNVDFVTIKRDGFERKLTGGEICNPFEDVVRSVPDSLTAFRLGYVIKTGRMFVIADGHAANGKTIAWAISGREVCRNNPDPDCLGARAIGPLPPGEYAFASDLAQRVSWGPKTKRLVSGIYLKKLWNRERFNPQQTAAILKRGNIAIHVRLKGEMSEACLGLEPKGWSYVASLIQAGRATGVDVHIDEPYPQIAEAPPVVTGSSFSLTSLLQ